MRDLECRLRDLMANLPTAKFNWKRLNETDRLEILLPGQSATRYIEILEVDDQALGDWNYACILGSYGNTPDSLDIDGRSGGPLEMILALVRSWLIESMDWDGLKRMALVEA